MDNIVYSYGGGEALYKVLVGVQMIFKSELSRELTYLMTFIGLAWAAFQGAQQTSWTPKLSWLTKYVLMTSLFLTPTATLCVRDSVTGYTESVDGLPIGLVLPASVFSSIGFGITQLFDQAFSDVDSNIPYFKYGQSFGASLISQSRNFKIQDSGFRENMESFIDNCVLYDVMVGRKYNASELKDSDNIWSLVSSNASNIRMMNYRDEDKSLGRKLVSCKEGVGLLNSYWTKDLNNLGQKFGNTIFGKYGSSISQAIDKSNQKILGKSFLANVNVVSQLYGKTGAATDTLKQIMMINAISDIPMSYGAVRAKQQQQESWLISGQLAREILPTLHAIFAALIYASFPLIIGMLVLPSGFRTLANYFGLLIWIETWPPLFAVLNLLTNVSSKTYGGDFTSITMSSASQIISHNSNISVVASGMMIVLPYLSYNILKGGAGQFVHLANQVMGSSQSAAMGASNEVTSGNRSLDNVSMMNGQWSNNSGFKTDMNRDYKSGQSSYQLADGTMVTKTADGNTIYKSGAGITHSVGSQSSNIASSDSSQTHQSLSNEKSLLVEKRKEYDETGQTMERTSIEYVKRMAAGMNSGENYNINNSTSSGKTLSSAITKAKELHNTFSYIANQGETISADANVNVGFGVGGTGGGVPSANITAGAGSSGRSETINTQNLTEDNGASVNTNVSKQTEDIARAAKDINYSETQLEEKALADSLSGSYEHMLQLRESISVSEQNIERFQTSVDKTHSNSVTESNDLYHKKLDFFANHEDTSGYIYGYRAAINIIENGGSLYNALNEEFISKTLPQQRMPTPNINYNNKVKQHIPKIDVKDAYNNVSETGNAMMEASGAVVTDAEEQFNKMNKVNSSKINNAEGKILNNGEKLQEKVNREENKRDPLSKIFLGRKKDSNSNYIP